MTRDSARRTSGGHPPADLRAASARSDAVPGARNGAMLRSLARREFGRAWVIVAAAAAAFCLALTQVALATMQSSGPDLLGRIVRRPDLTVLAGCAILAALRVAQRIEHDHRQGWLQPWYTAGGSLRRYTVGLIAAVTAACAGWFVAGATAFAAAVQVFGGSSEMLRALPGTVAGAILLIAGFTAFTGMIGMTLRESLSTVIVTAVLTAAPMIILLIHYQLTGTEAGWWAFWISLHAPLLQTPDSAVLYTQALLYVSVATAVAAVIAEHTQARQP